MLVNDGQEYIGTSGWRLSPEPCALALKAGGGVGGALGIENPVFIRSRVSRSLLVAFPSEDTHYSSSGRYALC